MINLKPAAVASWQMQKQREHKNFILAYQHGLFKLFEDRWNEAYFHALGLHVRIEPPGIGKTMDYMDVASSKLFRYQQKMGITSRSQGVTSEQPNKKECRYQIREGRYRMKAAQKGRIVVLPYRKVYVARSQLSTTSEGSRNNPSQGSAMKTGVPATDFARSTKM